MTLANPMSPKLAAQIMGTTEDNVRGIAKQLIGCYQLYEPDLKREGDDAVDFVKLVEAWPVDRSVQQRWLSTYRAGLDY